MADFKFDSQPQNVHSMPDLIDAVMAKYDLDAPSAHEKLLVNIVVLENELSALQRKYPDQAHYNFSLSADWLSAQKESFPRGDSYALDVLIAVNKFAKEVRNSLKLSDDAFQLVVAELLLDPEATTRQCYLLRELLAGDQVTGLTRDSVELAAILEPMSKPIRAADQEFDAPLDRFAKLTKTPELWQAAANYIIFARHFRFRGSNAGILVDHLNANRATFPRNIPLKVYLSNLRDRPNLSERQHAIISALITGEPLHQSNQNFPDEFPQIEDLE